MVKNNDMEKVKEMYVPPQICVATIRSERGYALSDVVEEWNGWGIEQEVQMMMLDGSRTSDAGKLDASHFSNGGTFSNSDWVFDNENGGWF